MNDILPDLPKQNKKKEADFGVYFKNWLVRNPLPESCTLELKYTDKDYIAFDEVKDRQMAYGIKASSEGGVLIRIQGTDGQPDYAFFRNSPAYVVIKYPRQFSIIRMQTFVLEKELSKRKSLTAERARQIAFISQSV